MEFGAPIPLHPPAEDGGTTMQTGGPAFAASVEPFTFVQVGWRDVPSSTRDLINAFRLWLQKDLNVRFHVDWYREETNPAYAKMSMALERVRKVASPYGTSEAQADPAPWNGQLDPRRPQFIKLDAGRPVERLLQTEAHEARHAWQFQNRSEFIELLLKSGASKAALDDREALVDFLEQDAQRYAEKAVARWRKGTR